MFKALFDKHRYTLMALLSGAILFGSGVALGIGLFGNQAQEAVEVTNTTGISGVQTTSDLSERAIHGKVNINTASADELDLLPGIGPVYSQRIIDYRSENGPFKAIAEIQNVSGIGPKTFEKLRDLITVSNQ